MPGYHKYVFDTEERTFVGRFDDMYKAEDVEGFDSWYESDLRELRKVISYSILSAYNYSRILEIGCGKGMFTHLLKKKNNYILATDISEMAIYKAKQSFPDIDFCCMDGESVIMAGEDFDLVLVMGTFAYIDKWRDIVRRISSITQWFYIAEYIPPKPIGFVKSPEQLVNEVEKYYKIQTKVLLDDVHCMLLAEAQ